MLLSVVIPSYNHEHFVLNTLRAAMEIDVDDKEIIIIDDGSTDRSVEVIREFIRTTDASANIRFNARENRGLVRTLNQALSLAQGKYIYVVASDDIPIPQGISRLIAILEKNDSFQFVLGNAFFFESEHLPLTTTYGETHRLFFDLPAEERQKEMFINYPNPLLLQATVFRKSVLQSLGGWREDIVLDDFSLFLRLFSSLSNNNGKDFQYEPEIMVCFYRIHQTNSFRNIERHFKMVEQALDKLCPPEWRDEALFRNFTAHTAAVLERGQLPSAARFIRSTVERVGALRCFVILPWHAAIKRLAR